MPTWNVVPQYPVVYGHAPSAYPFYNIIPGYNPVNVVPGSSQTPVVTEVEDPADNASNDLREEQNTDNKDDDTVAVESA